MIRRPPSPTLTYTLLPYTTLFRSFVAHRGAVVTRGDRIAAQRGGAGADGRRIRADGDADFAFGGAGDADCGAEGTSGVRRRAQCGGVLAPGQVVLAHGGGGDRGAIGRASCRDRRCQYGLSAVCPVEVNKKHQTTYI